MEIVHVIYWLRRACYQEGSWDCALPGWPTLNETGLKGLTHLFL